MTAARSPCVFIIDDDANVRASIQGLLKSVDLRSEAFGTPQEFLRCERLDDGPACLVLAWLCWRSSSGLCRSFCCSICSASR